MPHFRSSVSRWRNLGSTRTHTSKSSTAESRHRLCRDGGVYTETHGDERIFEVAVIVIVIVLVAAPRASQQFPYIVSTWIEGTPTKWSDSIPSDWGTRNKFLRQMADITLELADCTQEWRKAVALHSF
jgi:hypothetical protein